jgi:hypothetical protein
MVDGVKPMGPTEEEMKVHRRVMTNILNGMTQPHKYGCPQGYYGSTISLFMVMKREIRLGLLGDGPEFSSPKIARGVRSSCISIRKDAEEDLNKRIKLYVLRS